VSATAIDESVKGWSPRVVERDTESAGSSGLPALPAVLLEELARRGTIRSFPKNAVVVVEGEPAEAMYLILDGTLMVYVDDASGKLAELNRLGAGHYYGELMLGSAVRTASVKTLTPARLCMVRRDEFEKLFSERPDLAFHVVQTLISRVRSLTENVRGLALMDVYGRVARLLLDSVEDFEGRRLVRGLSQQAIAERVGASRSMINRILQDLTTGGYIVAGRREIELKRGLPKRW
jgi:CRP/FNR family cyclic AMP-dependent transcriptional regulator